MDTIASATSKKTSENNFLTPSHNSTEVIRVESLSKRYGKLVAVKGINFAVNRGEIFGLIGPDGAGKTTTFHILSGVMEASAGNVQILGKAPRNARQAIGYLTQKFSLHSDLSIDENLRYSAGLREIPEKIFRQRRTHYLRLMDLEKFSDRLAGKLSGGMKQKLALCCALISQPQILLLDEPTTGVDPVSRREFWDILATVASQGVTVVVATPYLDEAERCDRIGLMYAGQIQQIGTLTELRTSLGLQRLELRTNQLEATEAVLQGLINHRQLTPLQTSIVDVQTFGDRLDVLVKDAKVAIGVIQGICQRQNLKLDSIQIASITLENVFISRLRATGHEVEFIAFPGQKNKNLHYCDRNQSVAIGAYQLQKLFGNFQAVKNVNLEINYGEIYGLLGANGAGKTTTIKMLCGLLPPSQGKISLAGQVQNLRSSALRQKIGYMSQKFTLYDDLTIIQNLEFYCGIYSVPPRLRQRQIDWVLATCDLVGKENLLTGQLPGGWKQRVAFGASVMHKPEILFLDEPTSGVDPLARRQFWRLINEFARSGTAVLVTTHYLEEAEQCNRMGFMVAGEIVRQGSPSQIKAEQSGELLEIGLNNPQRGANILKNYLAPWRVSIFGDRLHIVLDRAEIEIPRLRSVLQAGNVIIHSLRSIPFSLEDAFINIVQRSHSRKA